MTGKRLKTAKKALCLIFAFLLSINSLAAIVSDNDGSAFVTKAEFEAMKKDFEDQVINYNNSIDTKIDGAISSYLAGIKLAKTEKVNLDAKTNYSFPLVMQSSVSSWNDPDSNYYNLARNRVRYFELTNTMFSLGGSNANCIQWNDQNIQEITTYPVGNFPTTNLYGFMQNTTTEIPGVAGELYYIENSGNTRTISGTNYKVFDIKGNGKGYQYLDYEKQLKISNQRNAGHFTQYEVFWWCYSGFLCNAPVSTQYSYTGPWNKINWTESRLYACGCGAGNNKTKYDQITPAHFGEKVKLKDIPEQAAGGSGGFDLADVPIDSSLFNWEKQSVKSMVYAGTATVPAQQKEKFAYTPITCTSDTYVEKIATRYFGYFRGFGFRHYGAASATSGTYQVRSMTYCPPLMAVAYNGYNSTIPSFSALPASCVRYYDENGKEHFLDEGMYLRTFDSTCKTEFDLTFGTKAGTKNLNLYLSKEPFDRVNGKTKLIKFKVDKETTEVTTKTLQTGKKYKISVDNIEKNDQLYMLWEPTTSSDYVALNSFENFVVISE